MRIAHLSDPHFSHFTLNPTQFFSKRWIGNFNFHFSRKKSYQTAHLWHLPKFLARLNVDTVFITGDLSSTSLTQEFTAGAAFVQAFKDQGLSVFVVPGNHDCYTTQSEKSKLFYRFFPCPDLSTKRIVCQRLQQGFWYIGLDCAEATPPFCSYGHFFEETEKALIEALSAIPQDERVIICNHFPLFPSDRPLHDLKRFHALQKTLHQFPQPVLYLHGHDHAYYIVDRQKEGLPLTLNCGSCAHRPNGAFFIIDLFEKECLIQQFLYTQENGWEIHWQKHNSLKM
jgi:3',5'-cyclic AMP phosphodiesterase CpdA